jgi:hypothetical protein
MRISLFHFSLSFRGHRPLVCPRSGRSSRCDSAALCLPVRRVRSASRVRARAEGDAVVTTHRAWLAEEDLMGRRCRIATAALLQWSPRCWWIMGSAAYHHRMVAPLLRRGENNALRRIPFSSWDHERHSASDVTSGHPLVSIKYLLYLLCRQDTARLGSYGLVRTPTNLIGPKGECYAGFKETVVLLPGAQPKELKQATTANKIGASTSEKNVSSSSKKK